MTIYPVIIAGGSGTRLWPLSREHHPKQFLPLMGEQSMLEETVLRLDGMEGVAAPVVVCNEAHRFLVADQMRQLGRRPSAIIVEPVAGNMGVIPPEPGFLSALRKLADEYGALLILDEVITGFRVAFGGAQELFGIKADITALGKIIGGGFPVGAYGGRADIMQCVSPLGDVVQAGTLSGNPIAMTAGATTLRKLKQLDPYPALEQQTTALREGLCREAARAGVEITCNQVGSLLTVFFGPGPIRNADDVAQVSRERYAAYFHGMLEAGVALAPSHLEAAFVSTAHSAADIAQTIEASRPAFERAAKV